MSTAGRGQHFFPLSGRLAGWLCEVAAGGLKWLCCSQKGRFLAALLRLTILEIMFILTSVLTFYPLLTHQLILFPEGVCTLTYMQPPD